MRFRIVESILTEDDPRGQFELREFICELLNIVCKSTLNSNDYELHHKDYEHNNYSPRNMVLLPKDSVVSSEPSARGWKKPNTSIHQRKETRDFNIFNDNSRTAYENAIDNYAAIDVYRSLRNGKITYLTKKELKRDLSRASKTLMGLVR